MVLVPLLLCRRCAFIVMSFCMCAPLNSIFDICRPSVFSSLCIGLMLQNLFLSMHEG